MPLSFKANKIVWKYVYIQCVVVFVPTYEKKLNLKREIFILYY